MAADMLVFASEGHLFPYLARFSVAGSPGESARRVLCVPILPRDGGFLLALPGGSIPPSLLQRGQTAGVDEMIGPSTELSVPAVEEEEDGSEVPVDSPLQVLVVDFATSAAPYLEPFDPASLEEPVPFLAGSPQVFPQGLQLVSLCKGWLRTRAADRLAFYTAPEEEEELLEEAPPETPAAKPRPKRVTTAQLADQLGSISQLLPTITSQLQEISEKQKALEAKVESRPAEPALAPHRSLFVFPTAKAGAGASGAGALASQVGPPLDSPPEGCCTGPGRGRLFARRFGARRPFCRRPRRGHSCRGPDSADSGPDPAGGTPDSELRRGGRLWERTRGPGPVLEGQCKEGAPPCRAGRKKRLLHAGRCPAGFSSHVPFGECAPDSGRVPGGASQVHLWPVSGKVWRLYGAQRELGLTMHMTTQIADVLLSGETDAALDLLALMMTCLEQVCQDGGKWEVGYTLSLFPEPAHQVFSSRGSPQNPRLRAWAPLCPAPWATTALAFLKEADNIIARRHEASGSATSSGKPADPDPAPRKPKAEVTPLDPLRGTSSPRWL